MVLSLIPGISSTDVYLPIVWTVGWCFGPRMKQPALRAVADQVSILVGLDSRLGWCVDPRLGGRKEKKRNDLLSGPGPVLGAFISINSRNSHSAQ